jgi:hypothetical protein
MMFFNGIRGRVVLRLWLMAAVISISVASHSQMSDMRLEPSSTHLGIAGPKEEPLIKIMGSLLSLTDEFHNLQEQDAAALGDVKGYCAGAINALGKGQLASKDGIDKLRRRISSLKLQIEAIERVIQDEEETMKSTGRTSIKQDDLRKSISIMKEQRASLSSSVAIANNELQSMHASHVSSAASAQKLQRECTRAIDSHNVRERQRNIQLKVLHSIGHLIGYKVDQAKELMTGRANVEESLAKLEVAVGVEKSRGVRQTGKVATAQNLDSQEISTVEEAQAEDNVKELQNRGGGARTYEGGNSFAAVSIPAAKARQYLARRQFFRAKNQISKFEYLQAEAANLLANATKKEQEGRHNLLAMYSAMNDQEKILPVRTQEVEKAKERYPHLVNAADKAGAVYKSKAREAQLYRTTADATLQRLHLEEKAKELADTAAALNSQADRKEVEFERAGKVAGDKRREAEASARQSKLELEGAKSVTQQLKRELEETKLSAAKIRNEAAILRQHIPKDPKDAVNPADAALFAPGTLTRKNDEYRAKKNAARQAALDALQAEKTVNIARTKLGDAIKVERSISTKANEAAKASINRVNLTLGLRFESRNSITRLRKKAANLTLASQHLLHLSHDIATSHAAGPIQNVPSRDLWLVGAKDRPLLSLEKFYKLAEKHAKKSAKEAYDAAVHMKSLVEEAALLKQKLAAYSTGSNVALADLVSSKKSTLAANAAFWESVKRKDDASKALKSIKTMLSEAQKASKRAAQELYEADRSFNASTTFSALNDATAKSLERKLNSTIKQRISQLGRGAVYIGEGRELSLELESDNNANSHASKKMDESKGGAVSTASLGDTKQARELVRKQQELVVEAKKRLAHANQILFDDELQVESNASRYDTLHAQFALDSATGGTGSRVKSELAIRAGYKEPVSHDTVGKSDGSSSGQLDSAISDQILLEDHKGILAVGRALRNAKMASEHARMIARNANTQLLNAEAQLEAAVGILAISRARVHENDEVASGVIAAQKDHSHNSAAAMTAFVPNMTNASYSASEHAATAIKGTDDVGFIDTPCNRTQSDDCNEVDEILSHGDVEKERLEASRSTDSQAQMNKLASKQEALRIQLKEKQQKSELASLLPMLRAFTLSKLSNSQAEGSSNFVIDRISNYIEKALRKIRVTTSKRVALHQDHDVKIAASWSAVRDRHLEFQIAKAHAAYARAMVTHQEAMEMRAYLSSLKHHASGPVADGAGTNGVVVHFRFMIDGLQLDSKAVFPVDKQFAICDFIASAFAEEIGVGRGHVDIVWDGATKARFVAFAEIHFDNSGAAQMAFNNLRAGSTNFKSILTRLRSSENMDLIARTKIFANLSSTSRIKIAEDSLRLSSETDTDGNVHDVTEIELAMARLGFTGPAAGFGKTGATGSSSSGTQMTPAEEMGEMDGLDDMLGKASGRLHITQAQNWATRLITNAEKKRRKI